MFFTVRPLKNKIKTVECLQPRLCSFLLLSCSSKCVTAIYSAHYGDAIFVLLGNNANIWFQYCHRFDQLFKGHSIMWSNLFYKFFFSICDPSREKVAYLNFMLGLFSRSKAWNGKILLECEWNFSFMPWTRREKSHGKSENFSCREKGHSRRETFHTVKSSRHEI